VIYLQEERSDTMTLQLELTPDLEQRLREKASENGVDAGQWLQEMVRQMLSTGETGSSPPPKRVAGLNRGQVVWMSEDFDTPLSDEFWMGETS